MPVPTINHFINEGGFLDVPYVWATLKTIPWLVLVYILKIYFGGARNTSERDMHSKVVMITGGTSGIGASIAKQLASRGAQIILLTHWTLDDPFLTDYIDDLRTSTSNELITAEHVDLASLHSIRLFATKWIDNAPPRRLDTLILCANTLTPRGGAVQISDDGVESNYAINYLANFHLLSILSPALRAQPPDRDVRIIFGTCSSYLGGSLPSSSDEDVPMPTPLKPKKKQSTPGAHKPLHTTHPSATYSSSKLALMTFASAFQKHLSSYIRPDKNPVTAKVLLVDPGYTRTPGMRRYLTFGSLWGLLLYLLTYPIWWLILKSPEQGAQTFLYAAMDARFAREAGGVGGVGGVGGMQEAVLLKECREYKIMRSEVGDEAAQKMLWEGTERAIERLEKEGAVRRAAGKKEKEKEKEDVGEGARTTATANVNANGNGERKAGSRRTRKAA